MRLIFVCAFAVLALAMPAGAAKPVDIAAEYAKGEAGWPAIVADYKKSDVRADEIVQILAKQLKSHWDKSNLANGFGPMRSEIDKRLEHNKLLKKEADRTAGQMLLYRACEQLDKNMADTVPAFLYGWIKPAEAV